MGLLASLVQEQRSAVYNPLHPRDPNLARLFGDTGANPSGVVVTEDTALSSTAMLAGVMFIAGNMASVPLKLLERAGRGKTPLMDDPRWWLLQANPNEEQTAFELREMVMGHVLLCGNGYVEIVEGSNGIADALWPIVPWRVRPVRSTSGKLGYVVRSPRDNTEVLIPAERMLHFRGFSRDGLLGVDVVRTMQAAIGSVLAAEQSVGAFFGNGAQPSGVLTIDKPLNDKAWERLKKQRDQMHGGVANWHRLAILEDGLKFQQLTTDPEKAQLLATRKYGITEVARILNLPVHVLKELERSTNNNIEHQGIELVTYTFRPWCVRFEQVLEKRLLLPRERAARLIRHNLAGFLRGDMKSRYEAYHIGRQGGWLSANDILEMEDQNGIGNQGDVYWMPVNMIDADNADALVPADDSGGAKPPDDDERANRRASLRERSIASWLPMFRQRYQALVRRETNAVRALVRKTADEKALTVLIRTWYDENAAFIAGELRPFVDGFTRQLYALACELTGGDPQRSLDVWIADYAKGIGTRDAATHRDDVLVDVASAASLLKKWDDSRAEHRTRGELERLADAVIALAKPEQ